METLSKADAAKEEKAKPIYTGPRLKLYFGIGKTKTLRNNFFKYF